MAEFSDNQLAGGTPATGGGSADVPEPKIKPPADTEPAIDSRLSGDDIENLVDYIQRTYDHSEKAREEWRLNLELWYKQYMGIVEAKDFPWKDCSNLHIPITAIVVDTILARVINPLYATPSFVNARPVSIQGPNQKGASDHKRARDVEFLISDVVNNKINAYDKIVDWVKESLIYGRGVIKIIWRKERRKYTKIVTEDEMEDEIRAAQDDLDRVGGEDYEDYLADLVFLKDNHDWEKEPFLRTVREETVYDNPDWVFVPISNFGFHPKAMSIQSSPYVYHKFRETKDNMVEAAMMGEYENVDQIPDSSGDDDYGGDDLLKDVQEMEEGYQNSDDESLDPRIHGHEFVEWQGRFDIDNDGRLENVIATVHLPSGTLLAARESEFLHGKKTFAEIKAFPMPGRFEAQGVPEMIRDLQQEINDIHNQRIDNGTIINSAMFKYDPNSEVDPQQHRIGPGMGFPDPNMELLPTGDVKASSFREEELVRRLIQDRIGVTDFAIGNFDQSQETATGIQNVVNEGNQRLQLLLRNIVSGINEAINQTFQLVQQFGSDEITFRVVEDAEESVRSVSAREIQGNWDIQLEANSVNVNRSVLLQELRTQIELALQAGPTQVNIKPLLVEFFEKIGSKVANKVVMSEQETLMARLQENPDIIPPLVQQIAQMGVQLGSLEQDPTEGLVSAGDREVRMKEKELSLKERELKLKELSQIADTIMSVVKSLQQQGKNENKEFFDSQKLRLSQIQTMIKAATSASDVVLRSRIAEQNSADKMRDKLIDLVGRTVNAGKTVPEKDKD